MSSQTMNLPINIPWKLIAASPDMLDTRFCNKQFPFAWRSSLSISAYQPKIEDLPEEMCGERITYFKISCSITGYQPSEAETRLANEAYLGEVEFPDIPTEEVERVLAEYFACYGVLLNVAVFPKPEYEQTLENFKSIWFARDIYKLQELPNPLHLDEVTFTATGKPLNRTVDQHPPGGDQRAELDLFNEMEITFPLSYEVRAHAVHYSSKPLVMKAFKGQAVVGRDIIDGTAPGQARHLAISHDGGIDRVIFEAPENKAYLLGIDLFHRVERPKEPAIEDLPRIVDFEPKVRDLYQAATDTGEILTASVSGIKTDKSFSHTESSETGLSLVAEVSGSIGQVSAKGEAGLTHTWGETDQDTRTIQTDASRERRESQSTTTNLNQMYNLLTGYHPGTNRAVFLMLPRPHVLQPTDRRTFVQGLRQIEGVQDFFLIVAHRKDIEAMCVEAFLETGHAPSYYTPPEPPVEYEESYEEFTISAYAGPGLFKGDTTDFEKTYTVQGGWFVDKRSNRKDGQKGQTVPGLLWYDTNTNQQAKNTLEQDCNTDDSSATVKGSIKGHAPGGDGAVFNRTYRVLTRSANPIPNTTVLSTRFFLTTRNLCACIQWEKGCPQVLDVETPNCEGPQWDTIVHESKISLSGALLSKDVASQSRMPAIKELLRNIQSEMVTSWRRASRHPYGEIGFLDTDYFKNRIRALLPRSILERKLAAIEGLPASVAQALGEDCTIDEALKLDLKTLIRKTGLSARAAADARRLMLGLKPASIGPKWDRARDSAVVKREESRRADKGK